MWKVISGVMLCAGIAIGIFIGRNTGETKFKIVKQTEIKYKTVYIDKPTALAAYSKMSKDELSEKLYLYENGIPALRGEMRGNTVHIEAGLSDRTWSNDIEIAGTSSGDWKIYAGIAAVSMAAGGYIIYKVVKK
jgi:hypothetical protein